MPYNQRYDLQVGDHTLPRVHAVVNIVPVPESRLHLPGAGSGIALDLTAVQQLVDLITEGAVSAAEVSTVLRSLANDIHEHNNEFEDVEEGALGGIRRGVPPSWVV